MSPVFYHRPFSESFKFSAEEKGRPIRIPANFEADVISGKQRYPVIIENLSEDGMFVRINTEKAAIDFVPGGTLDLEFQLLSLETLKPSKETLKIHCKVMWSNKTTPDGLTSRVGLEIIEKSQTYEEFYKIHYTNYMGIF